MKGTFRLAVVLRLREMAEDAARARLGQAVDTHRRATDALIELVERELGAQRRVERLPGRGRPGRRDRGRAARRRAGGARDGGRPAGARGRLDRARRRPVRRWPRRASAARSWSGSRSGWRTRRLVEAQRREDAVLSEIAGVRHARSLGAEVER